LSRQVRDLEEELGFLLLERSAKSVRLTEAGRVFLAESRAVLERVDASVEAGEGVALVTESLACVAGTRLELIGISPALKPLVVSAVWPESGLSAQGQRFLLCAKNAARNS
jgi:DNA-binding transcriptional LysR family regulator